MRKRYTAGVAVVFLLLAAGQWAAGCAAEGENSNTSTSTSSGTGAAGGQGGAGGGACGTELCDGADNDCDGDVDEGCVCIDGDAQPCYSGDPALIGIGACVEGTQTCDEQGVWGACEGEGLPGAEVCDGVDNDCNGQIDEGQVATTCGLGICSMTVEGCNDGQPNPCIPGSAEPPEDCEGLDDDCDGEIDETCACTPGTSQACYGGSEATRNVGACADGIQDCDVNGAWEDCDGDITPQTELCDDGIDNDCDGDVDEGCPCSDDATQPCYSGSVATRGVGTCQDGSQTCSGGVWGACSGDQTPELETCDSEDDDCDGTVDDGNPGGGAACNTGLPGPCGPGHQICEDGGLVCQQDGQGTAELCDGQDNDCDPSTLDGSADPNVGQACDGNDSDLCEEGSTVCTNAQIQCNDSSGSNADLCNGQDDDCDAASPDGSEDPQVGQACDGSDSDLCNEGLSSCVAGSLSCGDNTGSTVDTCDGVDNDCDPASSDGSEDPQLGQACDGGDSDLCTEGTRSCVNGGLACSDNTSSTVDLCNGQDDDCDPASTDGSEDPQVGQLCDGSDSDLCNGGTRSCVNGGLACSDDSNSLVDICNGQDDDCDPASSDGSEDPQVGQPCDGSDSDLCPEGSRVCLNGGLSCNDNTSSTVDLCNGQDDDCDAASSDGSEDPQVGQQCDGGDTDLCTEGTRGCVGGGLTCSDNTGSTTELCASDGVDEDCDGSIDEGFTRDDNPTCAGGTFYLGAVSGDTGGVQLTDSWYDEEWDRFVITEDDSSIFGAYLSARIQLVSPPGVDYDLYVYCNNCSGGLAGSSTIGGMTGHTDTVYVRTNEDLGVDDDFEVIVEVRHWASNICAYWTLTVTGNQPYGTETCN